MYKPLAMVRLLVPYLAIPLQAGDLPLVDVYESPGCGCCKEWIEHLERNGFKVRAHDSDDIVRHEYRLGEPPSVGSCHTAEVAGHVIGGHVPACKIKRLLKERPQARGLTVPGMPIGSSGMEQGARRDANEVLRVTLPGDTRVYACY